MKFTSLVVFLMFATQSFAATSNATLSYCQSITQNVPRDPHDTVTARRVLFGATATEASIVFYSAHAFELTDALDIFNETFITKAINVATLKSQETGMISFYGETDEPVGTLAAGENGMYELTFTGDNYSEDVTCH